MANPTPRIDTPFYADKSLYVAILGPLLIILSKKIGVDLNATEIGAMMASLVAFIVGNKWKTSSLTGKAIEAGAAAAQPATTGAAPGTAVPPAQQ